VNQIPMVADWSSSCYMWLQWRTGSVNRVFLDKLNNLLLNEYGSLYLLQLIHFTLAFLPEFSACDVELVTAVCRTRISIRRHRGCSSTATTRGKIRMVTRMHFETWCVSSYTDLRHY
jgi:hypothetical protein